MSAMAYIPFGVRQTKKTENRTAYGLANGVLLVALVLVIGNSVAVAVSVKEPDERPREILFGNECEIETLQNLGNGHLVIDREQWGASPLKIGIPLEHPIPYVLITHVGFQSSPCDNVYKCSVKMRTFQDSAIAEQKLSDINGNFYVGEDGNVYVGRGWDLANIYANKSLAVTFMGDYIRNEPSEKQLEAVQYLLSYGLTKKHIALDYKLVAQNQTKETHSPGTHVFKEIKKWPHWYQCGMNGNPKCGVEIGLPEVWNARQ